jgi:hypothetical protein
VAKTVSIKRFYGLARLMGWHLRCSYALVVTRPVTQMGNATADSVLTSRQVRWLMRQYRITKQNTSSSLTWHRRGYAPTYDEVVREPALRC